VDQETRNQLIKVMGANISAAANWIEMKEPARALEEMNRFYAAAGLLAQEIDDLLGDTIKGN